MAHPFFLVSGSDMDLGIYPGNTEDEAITAYLVEASGTAPDDLTAARAVGRVAIRAAKNTFGVTLYAYAAEDGQPHDEVSIDEAEEIADVDVSLVYAVA